MVRYTLIDKSILRASFRPLFKLMCLLHVSTFDWDFRGAFFAGGIVPGKIPLAPPCLSAVCNIGGFPSAWLDCPLYRSVVCFGTSGTPCLCPRCAAALSSRLCFLSSGRLKFRPPVFSVFVIFCFFVFSFFKFRQFSPPCIFAVFFFEKPKIEKLRLRHQNHTAYGNL